MKYFLLDRLKEKSTWISIGTVCGGVTLSILFPPFAPLVSKAVIGILTANGILTPERGY